MSSARVYKLPDSQVQHQLEETVVPCLHLLSPFQPVVPSEAVKLESWQGYINLTCNAVPHLHTATCSCMSAMLLQLDLTVRDQAHAFAVCAAVLESQAFGPYQARRDTGQAQPSNAKSETPGQIGGVQLDAATPAGHAMQQATHAEGAGPSESSDLKAAITDWLDKVFLPAINAEVGPAEAYAESMFHASQLLEQAVHCCPNCIFLIWQSAFDACWSCVSTRQTLCWQSMVTAHSRPQSNSNSRSLAVCVHNDASSSQRDVEKGLWLKLPLDAEDTSQH